MTFFNHSTGSETEPETRLTSWHSRTCLLHTSPDILEFSIFSQSPGFFFLHKPNGFCQKFPKGIVRWEVETLSKQKQYITNINPKEKCLWKEILNYL